MGIPIPWSLQICKSSAKIALVFSIFISENELNITKEKSSDFFVEPGVPDFVTSILWILVIPFLIIGVLAIIGGIYSLRL
jgi:preprotein translocase subunit SecG